MDGLFSPSFLESYGYYVVFVLTAIVYQLGFARRLPWMKTLVVYLFLAIGCIPLTVLAGKLPIIESLGITIVFLILVHIRRRQSKASR